MEAAEGSSRRSKRARRAVEVAPDAGSSSERTGASTPGRPTPAELQEALDVIKQMKEAAPPLLGKGAPPNPNVVACAIALWRREPFADDRAALLSLFGAHPETNYEELGFSEKHK